MSITEMNYLIVDLLNKHNFDQHERKGICETKDLIAELIHTDYIYNKRYS